ncbi:2Fe-2S iron-sulfur cluster-binding protein [Bordetella trematum]|uniref:2Fe-2S iron-sulfur cluster-binding protein n=1 Tax=Bordetella trematum TaxID=123899 RepID=UPI00398A1854
MSTTFQIRGAGAAAPVFIADHNETLLQAGLRQAAPLDYLCGSGGCGSCEARLLQGTVCLAAEEGSPLVVGQEGEAAPRVLLCQSRPRTDCVLQLRLAAALPQAATPSQLPATLSDIRPLGGDLYQVTLALPRTLPYLAGQYLMVQAPGLPGQRAYSIAGVDPDTGRVRLIVAQRGEGCFSRWLTDPAHVGQALLAFGPMGRASLAPRPEQDMVVIAGGSGISVGLAALQWAASERFLARRRMWLFWGVRDAGQVAALTDELAARQRGQAGLHIAVCSDAAPPAQALGVACEQGYPVDRLTAREDIDWTAAAVYVTGPPAMVAHTLRTLLTQTDIEPDAISSDNFY